MKQTLTCAMILFCISLSAQPWRNAAIVSVQQNNYYDLQKQFHSFWNDKKIHLDEEENAENGGYQQFARWEHFMETRAYPSGKISDPDILIKEYERTKLHRNGMPQIQAANWSFIGPHVVPNNGGGAGRVNCIAFHPANNTIIYVGTASGGMWQTTDGGLTWSSTSDQLASLSIADIAIDPLNPDNIYLATGDGYGYEVWGNIFWGGTYTAGVMKSIDGGLTWAQAGLTYAQTQSEIIQRIIINPLNPSILLACTRNAIYRTIDGAATWTLVQNGHFYDMEFNALNPNTVYAVNDNNVFRSLNGGITFQVYSNALASSGRISIAVTPADTNIMYAFTEDVDFYRSVNSGQTFTSQTSPGGTFYGYYDCVLEASPVDPLRVLTGGVGISMSDNGGLSWNAIDNNGGPNDYVHADKHALAFLPGSNSTIYTGNDGGFFKTIDSGASWTDLSNGLDIKQYYRISSSQVNPDVIYAGAQDNGTDQLKNSVWTHVFGGDGMDCLADYNDENTAYVSYQYGNFSVTTDGGQFFSNIAPAANGHWITPIAQDPADPNTIYIGYQDLYKSPDKGTTWNNIATGIFTDNIQQITIAPSNHDYIYMCNLDEIYMTSNGGGNWINIAPGLPVANAAMTGIAVSSSDPQHVWVTFSGYVNGTKVFKSVDGGSTWTNVSGTLPNIPADCIVYQKNTNDELYLGTDFGVYYTNDTLNDWVPYQNGLPNVIVDDMEVNYTASKLRVASYGRGIWESDLNTTTLFSTDGGVKSITSPTGVSCANAINPIVEIKNFGIDTLYTIDINYKVDNGPVQIQPWTGILASMQTDIVTLNSMAVSGGLHTFTAYTSNPNGTADGNSANDQKISTFEIDNTVIPYPVTEGFESGAFPVPDWKVQGAQMLLSIKPVGGFGNSSFSMRADFYNIAAVKAYLTSKRVNLTNVVSPVRLDFNVAYAEYSSQYHDSLKVDVSTDCGATWTTVYSKTGPVLATAPATINMFSPTASQWRAESINLDTWIGFPEVTIRFDALSDFGNELYIDDINLYDGTVGIHEVANNPDIIVYPVPFNNSVNIDAGNEILSSVLLTDVTGRKVAEQLNIQTVKHTVNTDILSKGLYLLKVSTKKGTFVKKIVKE
jgi:photosystem II stability/assembly factor-like uncharacterized protein